MRLLQDLSVLQGTELTNSDPGNWIDVTSDSSVQIICLDHLDSDDISLYSDETREKGRVGLSIRRDENNEMKLPLTKGNKLATDFMRRTNIDLEPKLNTYNKTLDSDDPSQGRLSGKAWFSDSCLNNPTFRTGRKKSKDFASTDDLTSDAVKPILRKPRKRRKTVRKTVSFKESGTETRYFVKCDYINDKDEAQNNIARNYSEFNARDDEAKAADSDGRDSEELMKKPITASFVTKVAKVVKCPTVTKTAKLSGSCRQRIAVKRKLVQCQKVNSPVDSTAEQPEIDLGILLAGSEDSPDKFPDRASKIPRYSGRKRDHNEIEPLSKFLMENDKTILTSTPKALTQSCPDIFREDNQDIQSKDQDCGKKLKCLTSGSRQHLRMGTSNLKSIHCQKRLSFNETVNKANISDVNRIPQQKSVAVHSKPTRPRLGIHCKSSKLVELDTLERNLVGDLKKRNSKCNRGIKIKTNGSLKCTPGTKRSDCWSPRVKSFKRTVRPSPCTLKLFPGALYLESCV